MFKNIERKHKAIEDKFQQMAKHQVIKRHQKSDHSNFGSLSSINAPTIFNSQILEYLNERSQYKKKSQNNSIDEVVWKFIDQDSAISVYSSLVDIQNSEFNENDLDSILLSDSNQQIEKPQIKIK